MIRNREEKPPQKIEIDLTGPEGNAFFLMSYAQKWGRQLGYSEHRIKCIIDEMKLTNYEGLIHTFDREFGHFVTIWR
jgi:predicted Zn-dependent protease